MEMKMNLKSWLLTPLLALLVACGGGSDDKADTPATPTPRPRRPWYRSR
jgi:ABC-type glycerol-3-phosphate transport system substrate-binding protein